MKVIFLDGSHLRQSIHISLEEWWGHRWACAEMQAVLTCPHCGLAILLVEAMKLRKMSDGCAVTVPSNLTFASLVSPLWNYARVSELHYWVNVVDTRSETITNNLMSAVFLATASREIYTGPKLVAKASMRNAELLPLVRGFSEVIGLSKILVLLLLLTRTFWGRAMQIFCTLWRPLNDRWWTCQEVVVSPPCATVSFLALLYLWECCVVYESIQIISIPHSGTTGEWRCKRRRNSGFLWRNRSRITWG